MTYYPLRSLIKNKRAGYTDLFLFMIIAFVLVLCSGIFLFVANTTTAELHTQLDSMSTNATNYTQILNNTIDKVPVAYQVLKWGAIVIIAAMIMSIFIGSYMVTTKPIFFIPYAVIVLVAFMFSVVIANAYDELLNDSILGATLHQFIGANFMLLYLPMIIGAVGMIGAIVMFASYKLGSGENVYQQ